MVCVDRRRCGNLGPGLLDGHGGGRMVTGSASELAFASSALAAVLEVTGSFATGTVAAGLGIAGLVSSFWAADLASTDGSDPGAIGCELRARGGRGPHVRVMPRRALARSCWATQLMANPCRSVRRPRSRLMDPRNGAASL